MARGISNAQPWPPMWTKSAFPGRGQARIAFSTKKIFLTSESWRRKKSCSVLPAPCKHKCSSSLTPGGMPRPAVGPHDEKPILTEPSLVCSMKQAGLKHRSWRTSRLALVCKLAQQPIKSVVAFRCHSLWKLSRTTKDTASIGLLTSLRDQQMCT